jgi:predicted TIM-barrel fold metal-dependent hydrolase
VTGPAVRVIDVHHHFVPSSYARQLEARGVGRVGGGALPIIPLEQTLASMDELDVATAVLSISAPGVSIGDTDLAVQLARETNEAAATIRDDHPGRFGALASLPIPELDRSLDELAYALDVLHLDGVVLLTNVGGVYLGDPSLDPLLDELDRRHTVAFVHPTVPPGGPIPACFPAPVLEFTFETARALANLLVHDAVRRYAGIRFLVAHAGGAFPYVAGRASTVLHAHPAVAPSWHRTLLADAPRLYYDTALSTSPPTLAGLRTLVGTEAIVFGTDAPFSTRAAARDSLDTIRDAFSADEAAQVLQGNASALFPRLGACGPGSPEG